MARRRRAGNDPGERGCFSARRKTEAVLRRLHGEDVDTVSRELGVTPRHPGWLARPLPRRRPGGAENPARRPPRRGDAAAAGQGGRTDDGQ